MAKNPTDVTGEAPVKVRRARKPSEPKPIYAIVQVMDEYGNTMSIPKGQVKLISFEKNAEQVLQKIEGGEHPNALYLRGTF